MVCILEILKYDNFVQEQYFFIQKKVPGSWNSPLSETIKK